MKTPLILKTFNSPFKTPKLKFYFGKVAVGVPVFYPRKWVRLTTKEALERALESINNPNLVQRSFDCWVEYHKKNYKAVPKKIGFDFCDIYWKTKWSSTDYRFEYPSVFSFVFFKWQFAITFQVDNAHHYFECFLFYHFNTDRKLSVKDRLEQAKKEFPCTWKTYKNGVEEKVCQWDVIIKEKYNKQVNKH